jgi:hypothetical protein
MNAGIEEEDRAGFTIQPFSRAVLLSIFITAVFLHSQAGATECRALYGIHDAVPDPTEYLNHVQAVSGCGWVTATVAVGHNPTDTSGADFSALAGQGHTVICRINNGYFPNGTIPLAVDYDNFALRCSNFVAHSSGCNIWLIGNECNLAGEWPFNGTKFAYVSPQNYATCFRKVYNAIKALKAGDKVLSMPPAPFAGPYGVSTLNGSPADGNPLNWVQYLNQTLTAIQSSGPLDGIALHITSRGYAFSDIHSTSQVNAGGQLLYFSFYVYQDWVNYGIPPSLYNLPLYATECNGYYYWKGGHPEDPTKHYLAGWMQEIYAEINRYNQSAFASGKPLFRCVNMYRWCATCDGWNVDGTDNPYRAQILSDLDAAVGQNYTWPVKSGAVTVLPPGSVWKYLDDGSDQGTLWRTTNFNDSAWASGPAQLGYGGGDEATVVNSGPTNNHYITTYFRRSFAVTNASFFTNLTLRLLRADGGVVYLNGTEIFRSNMPTNGTILFSTLASSSVSTGDGTTNFYPRPVNPRLLFNGTNLLAVEIHQASPTSPGLSFDLGLSGIGNTPPVVSLGSPGNGAVLGSANLTMNVLANDDDGLVSKVEFYLGALKLGQDTNPPFSLILTNVPEGNYTLTAIATDNGGSRSTSAPVNVTLYASLVATGSVWKYLDNGTDQGTAWRATNFTSDSAWAFGPGQLGYGDGDEATVVNGGPSTNHFITTYFRRRFPVSNPSTFTNLLLRLLRDDGAVVYLNGTEVFRSNMPTNVPITYATLASSTVSGGDETTNFFSTMVKPGLLVNGTNLLAVEIHQVLPTSSDISFDLELLGLRPSPPPRLSIQSSGSAALLCWSAFAQNFRPEGASNLGAAAWSALTNIPALTNFQNSISVPLDNSGGFYRLSK